MRYGTEIAAALNAELCLLHVTGRPAETIASYANHVDADLILLPTRGRGLLGQVLFGSTTMDVLRIANRPLWVAKPQSVRAGRPIRNRRVLCGVELGAEGESVLNYAARWAAAWDGELLIVHVVPGIEFLPEAARRRIASMAAAIDVPWQAETQAGDVAETIRKFAKRWRADVVVVGRGRKTDRWQLGANIGNIIARSPCPVITCPGRSMRIRPRGHRMSRRTVNFPGVAGRTSYSLG